VTKPAGWRRATEPALLDAGRRYTLPSQKTRLYDSAAQSDLESG